MKGFYLSKWQGKQSGSTWVPYIDLPRLLAARPELGFCYLKGTQGATAVDPTFDGHRRMCADAKIPTGVFHYLTNDKPVVVQARHFWNVCGGSNHGYILLPSADVEDPAHLNLLNSQLVSDFLNECDVLWGGKTLPYTRQSFWDPYVRRSNLARGLTRPDPRFAGRLWWLAHYNDRINTPWLCADSPDYAIWQIGQTAVGEYPGAPYSKFTIEVLNPRLTVADISFPAPVKPPIDSAGLYDNLTLMLQDFGQHGRVTPYRPIAQVTD